MLKKRINVDNVVILRTDRIGEVLLSTVAAGAIKECYPEASVSFITSEYSRPIVEMVDAVDEILITDTGDKTGWIKKGMQLAFVLRKKKFDAAIVLNPNIISHLAVFFAGIPLRIGYDRKWGFFLNRKIQDQRDKGEKHEVEYTLDLLKLLDIKDSKSAPNLSIKKDDSDRVERILRKMGVSPEKTIVAIHPGSSNPAKIWPSSYYAELIDRLKTELDCEVAILGGKNEISLSEGIRNASKTRALDFAGDLDLKELAAMLERSALFIGNDAGPMHMAAAVNIPVIAIFGRNIPGVSPTRWRPWGKRHVVLYELPGCAPCLDVRCEYEYKCLKAITVDAVLEAAKKILGES